MGTSESKHEEKTVDATGNVNNNVVIGGPVDVYSLDIVILLGIICFLKITEFIYFIYTKHYRNMKKRINQQLPMKP